MIENYLISMAKDKYNFAFCASGFLHHETVKLAKLFAQTKDWDAVKKIVLEENILQTRTKRSAGTYFSKLTQRLKTLTESQMVLLLENNPKNEVQILWIAICKCYRYVREFAVEVVREKYLKLDLVVERQDYDSFFNKKAEWHEEVDKLTFATSEELRGTIFRYLKEAEILTKDHLIIPTHFSPEVASAIANDSKDLFSIFPISAFDIKELKI
jgi:hypothetical protein